MEDIDDAEESAAAARGRLRASSPRRAAAARRRRRCRRRAPAATTRFVKMVNVDAYKPLTGVVRRGKVASRSPRTTPPSPPSRRGTPSRSPSTATPRPAPSSSTSRAVERLAARGRLRPRTGPTPTSRRTAASCVDLSRQTWASYWRSTASSQDLRGPGACSASRARSPRQSAVSRATSRSHELVGVSLSPGGRPPAAARSRFPCWPSPSRTSSA